MPVCTYEKKVLSEVKLYPIDLGFGRPIPQRGRPLLARQPFAPTAFDQVILGCVNVIADEMNPARVAALRLCEKCGKRGHHAVSR